LQSRWAAWSVAGLSTIGWGLALGPVVAASPPAVTATGWWTRSPTATAPHDGVVVGNAPDGPTSVAAVAVDVGATGSSPVVLRFRESGGALQPAAAVRVCLTTDQWTPATGGSLASAPRPQCIRSVDASRASSGQWTADVASILAGHTGVVSLMLLPGPSAPMFEVQSDPPAVTGQALPPAGLSAAGGEPPSGSPGPPTDGAGPASSPLPTAALPSGPVKSVDASPPLFAPKPYGPSAPATSLVLGATPTSGASSGAITGLPSGQLSASQPADSGRGSRLGHLMLFVLISIGTGSVAGLVRSRIRPAAPHNADGHANAPT